MFDTNVLELINFRRSRIRTSQFKNITTNRVLIIRAFFRNSQRNRSKVEISDSDRCDLSPGRLKKNRPTFLVQTSLTNPLYDSRLLLTNSTVKLGITQLLVNGYTCICLSSDYQENQSFLSIFQTSRFYFTFRTCQRQIKSP